MAKKKKVAPKKITKKTSNNRLYVFISIGVITLLVLFYLIQKSLQGTFAASPKINLSFNPSSGKYKLNQVETTSVVLQTGSSNQKISGFNVVLNTSGAAMFKSVGDPIAVGAEPLQIRQLSRTVTATEARIAYTFLNASSVLPQTVVIPVSYVGTGDTMGKIVVDSASSQVVGPISGNSYIWGKVGTANFTFSK